MDTHTASQRAPEALLRLDKLVVWSCGCGYACGPYRALRARCGACKAQRERVTGNPALETLVKVFGQDRSVTLVAEIHHDLLITQLQQTITTSEERMAWLLSQMQAKGWIKEGVRFPDGSYLKA